MKSGKEGPFYYLNSIDHLSIFPHCQLVILHGGAGTTQSALECLAPSLIISHGLDQDYWGARLVAMGCSPAYFQRNKMKQKDVEKALLKMKVDGTYLYKTQEAGLLLKKEEGLQRAIEELEFLMDSKSI